MIAAAFFQSEELNFIYQIKWIINFEYLTDLDYNGTLESLKKRLCLFPEHQIYWIEHHLLKNSPESAIQNVCQFLGIDQWFLEKKQEFRDKKLKKRKKEITK